MTDRTLVSVVDDDESVRESLPDLLWQLGYATQVFASAEHFLASNSVEESSILILDISMPGMPGPDLFEHLADLGHTIPTIFITAKRDKDLRPRLLARGAVECLFKPFSEAELLRALSTAAGEKQP